MVRGTDKESITKKKAKEKVNLGVEVSLIVGSDDDAVDISR